MMVLSFLYYDDPSLVLDLVQRLASVSMIISSLEFLAMDNILLSDGGLMSWKVNELSIRYMGSQHFQTIIGYVFEYPGVLVVIFIRLLSAIILLLFGITQGNNNIFFETILVTAIAATSIILVTRAPYGHSAADQMSIILFVTIAIAYAFGSSIRLLSHRSNCQCHCRRIFCTV
jgi:hypothetical protein